MPSSTTHNPRPVESVSEIWQGDFFGRREEAELLIGYIESVGARPTLQEDHRGFTLAIDADYGIGKTYFLRRLAKHLALSHPVAFVDAWTDDLSDEPLTAIAATLRKALSPLMATPAVQEKWDRVANKTGEVAKIVAKGLAKKGLGLLITGTAVEALENIVDNVGYTKEELEAAAKDIGDSAGSDTVDAITAKTGKALLNSRIDDFEAGQASVRDLKNSLSSLVETVANHGLAAPIVIIVDELDRCRPTYAIKLLEEVKHLFDVPGIVFVFGLHSDQLARSVAGAYGSSFDGHAYLRRFINRTYALSFPDMEPLINHLAQAHGINLGRLDFLPVEIDGRRADDQPVANIARYMRAYGMTARDAFGIMDMIQTCLAVGGTGRLFMPLLLPMIIGHLRGLKEGAVPPLVHEPLWTHTLYDQAGNSNEYVHFKLEEIINRSKMVANWNQRQIMEAANNGDNISYVLIDYMRGPAHGHATTLRGYSRLLQRLSRFSSTNQTK